MPRLSQWPVQMDLYLDHATHDAWRSIALRHGSSINAVVREEIRTFLQDTTEGSDSNA